MTKARSQLAAMMPDAFPLFFARRQPYPAQAMVMPEIVRGQSVLFAAPTASGKTEAAIAPLYQRHISFRRRGLSTVYVAPTKALVNDLYERISTYLAGRQPGTVTRYTGDRHELGDPSEVFCLLATPEALDSLLLRRPDAFAAVRAVVVDEIHLLHGQPRGQQLRHVIARIARASSPPESSRDGFHVVGMTATLDDMEGVAKVWLGEDATVMSHGEPREIDLQMIDVPNSPSSGEVEARAVMDWLESSGVGKILVFANSRNSAHALAAHLHQQAVGTRWPVHLHFGVLAAGERERVEHEMRTLRHGICVATSTLEIGIDIGDVDAIVLSNAPGSVNGFLQRIGRGNRRSGVCRVVALRRTDAEEEVFRALLDCARRGDLDDVFEYDRPSVRFQQVLSLCWRATRQDHALTPTALCVEAGDEGHKPVIVDMLETGALDSARGALVPSDRLMDLADAGRIHSVIAGGAGSTVMDMRTGKSALRDADQSTVGGALLHGGTLRKLMLGSDGEVFLGDETTGRHPLARIRSSSRGLAMSKAIVFSLARRRGYDPQRWLVDDGGLITWGGETLNHLLAALLKRADPRERYKVTAVAVTGNFGGISLSIPVVRAWAQQAQVTGDLPVEAVERFTNPSRFLNELSLQMTAREKRGSVPWVLFQRWLDGVTGIDRGGLGSHVRIP